MADVTLETLAESFQTHLVDCLEVRREANRATDANTLALKAVQGEIKEFKKLPMKAVRWIGGIVISAAITVSVTQYLTTQHVEHVAQTTATVATATASDQRQIIHRLDQIQYPFGNQ